MADEALTNEQVAEMRKKRTFRKFTFRGIDLDKLLDLSLEVIAYPLPPPLDMRSMSTGVIVCCVQLPK